MPKSKESDPSIRPQIKQGVATTLALLGTHPPVLRGDASTASSVAPGIGLRKSLGRRATDATPETWTAVSEVLPLLAEAAPDTILEGLRTCLCRADIHLRGPCSRTGGSDEFDFGPNRRHILGSWKRWKCWHGRLDHLMGVVNMLAELAETDPGGRYSNRPSGKPCVDHVPLDALHLGRGTRPTDSYSDAPAIARARRLAADAVNVASYGHDMQMSGQAGLDIEAGSRLRTR